MSDQRQSRILIVDDQEINRIILAEILNTYYMVDEAESGSQALDIMLKTSEKPDLVLMDVMMPDIDGFTAVRMMKEHHALSHIPVIFITAAIEDEKRGLEAGAVDYILKPINPQSVLLRVANHIELCQYRQRLEQMVEDKVNELANTKETFLATMANIIEYRSVESGLHVMRTKTLSEILAKRLLTDSPYCDLLLNNNLEAMVKAVPLHDIGKIAINDDILLKPGKLTPEEFEIIKTHTTVGAQIIQSLIDSGQNDWYIRHCYDICLYHHERWDGKGYPMGICGASIPISARIVALVDVYDALVSERCYKKAYTHEEAIEIIRESSGTHFDPAIVDAFLNINEMFKNIE